MNNKITEVFKNPPCEFRGAPFWAWNGKMEPEELRRQIRLMKEMGLGGFFMHARVGLNTEYLGDAWFECINACIDEAEKFGMYAWLYDEDRWPSGAAGGEVTKDPAYRQRFVVLEEIASVEEFKPTDSTLAVFTATVCGDKVSGVRRVTDGVPRLGPGEKIVHFHVKIQEPSPWFNDQAYLDTLNEKAVEKFIESTHEKYKREIAGKFGKSVPGIFFDEPCFGAVFSGMFHNPLNSTPWTDSLPDVFRSRYDYDIIDHLMEIYFDVDGIDCRHTRFNYMDCITHLFVSSFAMQIGKWCEEHHLLSTGHLFLEDTLSFQTAHLGSAMRSYEYMQAPGMDELTEYWRIYDAAKQVSSVARQFDRKWRLSETNGCTGWDFPFAGHKAVSDWQAALGINLRCQHLYWYTMDGEAKRDYPAAISSQSPWWKEYSYVEDYFARINAVMAEGQEIRDLLVISPVESVWTMIKKDWMQSMEVEAADVALISLRDFIHDANIDFDYGDEDIMLRHGQVISQNGKTVLQIGHAEYKVVVVPELITMRSSTLKLLTDFHAAGGKVVMLGTPAVLVDGIESNAVAEFSRSCTMVATLGPELISAVEGFARSVSIAGTNGQEISRLLHLQRTSDDHTSLFICNTGYTIPPKPEMVTKIQSIDRTAAFPQVTVNWKTQHRGEVLELDPVTGEIFRAIADKTTDGWKITTSLDAIGSRMFVAFKRISTDQFPLRKTLKTVSQQLLAQEEWQFARSEDNVLMLDRAQYCIDGGDWQNKEYILSIDKNIRAHLDLPERGGQMVQPWARRGRISQAAANVEIKYEFNCDVLPNGALYFCIEKPEQYQIAVNGNLLSNDMECGWWCDPSLCRLPVDPIMLHYGINEITLKMCYDETCGLEFVYLLGDFGVVAMNEGNTLIAAPRTLRLGDWVPQGLPYYSGPLTYITEFEMSSTSADKVFLCLPEFRGVAAVAYINGKRAGVIGFPPYETEITIQLQSGKNMVAIEILNSRRNSHGPFHHEEKWPEGTGPETFHVDSGKLQLVPCGLLQPPVIEFKR